MPQIVQQYNTHLRAKISLRREAMDWLAPEPINLIETHGGEGYLYRAAYAGRVATATAIEKNPRCAGAGRVMIYDRCERALRHLDLSPYNLIDVDPYGDPWFVLYLIARRLRLLPPRRRAILLTCGEGKLLGMKTGISGWVNDRIGLSGCGNIPGPALVANLDYIRHWLIMDSLTIARLKAVRCLWSAATGMAYALVCAEPA